MLIKAGADINYDSATGETPVVYAASMNWFDTVYYLLEAGADFRKKDRQGCGLCYEIIDSTVDADHELARWREKVIAWLRERAVSFDEAEEMLEGRARKADLAAQNGIETAQRNAERIRARLKHWHEEQELRNARLSAPKKDREADLPQPEKAQVHN